MVTLYVYGIYYSKKKEDNPHDHWFNIYHKWRKEQVSFIDFVDQIINITKNDDYLKKLWQQANVKNLENQIDQLVYKPLRPDPRRDKDRRGVQWG